MVNGSNVGTQAFCPYGITRSALTAVWMLPTNNVYGGWPRSGEIDIMESRGNDAFFCGGQPEGHQKAASTLHWGPDPGQNHYYQTTWPKYKKVHVRLTLCPYMTYVAFFWKG